MNYQNLNIIFIFKFLINLINIINVLNIMNKNCIYLNLKLIKNMNNINYNYYCNISISSSLFFF